MISFLQIMMEQLNLLQILAVVWNPGNVRGVPFF
jgi:hypothetical protein